jgi:hypothetical protein
MTVSALRRRKEDAYATAAPADDIEARVLYLGASPYAIAYDLHGGRLLYHRADWHYRVRRGADPEEIVDYGHVDTAICSLPGGETLTDVEQGEVLAVVASEPVDSDPGWGGQRVVEMIAVDPTSGNFVVYSHREDVENPYQTDVAAFEGATGGRISFATLPQPLDGSARWHVPHAICYDGWLYASERDDTTWPEVGPATGRVVRRLMGNLGTLSQYIPLPEGERFIFPHSLALDGENGILFVLSTRLNNPGTLSSYQTSGITTFDAESMSPMIARPVDFDFDEQSESERPYYLGAWEAAGGPNTGGLILFDGSTEDGGYLIASGYDPSVWDPLPWASRQSSVFRWRADGRGVHVTTIGDALPVPLFRTESGLLGGWQSTTPPEALDL